MKTLSLEEAETILAEACSASAIAVPPMGFKFRTNDSALDLFSEFAGTGFSKSGSTSVEKRTTSNRSSSPRFAMQNRRAFLACSSFFPAMEPEVSKTNTTSLGTTLRGVTSTPGEANSRK